METGQDEEIVSFRDPDGYIFISNGEIYRQVNNCYKINYDRLMSSGLYETLTSLNLLIPHIEEYEFEYSKKNDSYKVLKPEKINVIAYPFELCFSQLKDSALAVLNIMEKSLSYDMILKDASSYNVQFHNGLPVFIDTLSFEIYNEGEPWIGYHQFCKHYIAPLCLMRYLDGRANKLLQVNLDGLPLDLCSKFLPVKSYFSKLAFIHIHLNYKLGTFLSNVKSLNSSLSSIKISKDSLLSLIRNLKKYIENTKLKEKSVKSVWENYYETSNYSESEFEIKKQIVKNMVDKIKSDASNSLDIGANTGVFSRLLANSGIFTVSIDNDMNCIEQNYIQMKSENIRNLVPLNFDFVNIYSRTGWAGKEQLSLLDRFKPDLCLALAVTHHLRITSGIPLMMLADLFQKICKYLIIEFVPKSDKQTASLLKFRKDIYYDYSQFTFEASFSRHFKILQNETIGNTGRIIYLMQKY
ncbi:SAM-dependent methyltransferase [Candidatus Dependentiae bacterium]|nr:SAM-dependent methyltransferase [Candidatus Dependentiae bacterium]